MTIWSVAILLLFKIVWSTLIFLFIRLQINNILKPDLVSVVTAYNVYFCAFASFEIFQKSARELGMGHGPFHSGVSGLIGEQRFSSCKKFQVYTPFGFRPETFQGFNLRSFNKRPQGDWDGNKQQPPRVTNKRVCSD